VLTEPDASLERRPDLDGLFRAHYGRLVRALGLACGDVEHAADAVQEAFVRAHVRWRRIRHYEDPVGWIRRVAVNLLRDERRRSGRKQRAIERLGSRSEAQVGPPNEPDQLDVLLRELPIQQRTAVALYYVEGLDVGEVADAMQVAEGTVKSHLFDARRKLRAAIDPEGG
jgi:RNA polymerase sigma-70 factor, ECF subfamily